jgi:hypothetical protein
LPTFEKQNNLEQVSFSQRQTMAAFTCLSRPGGSSVVGAKRWTIAFIPVTQSLPVMETVVLRILLLIVLFILLTGDYTELFNQILQQGTKSASTPRDASRRTSKSYDDDDTDVTQIDHSLEMHCESLHIIRYLDNSTFAYLTL